MRYGSGAMAVKKCIKAVDRGRRRSMWATSPLALVDLGVEGI
jgi:hypothetical protein